MGKKKDRARAEKGALRSAQGAPDGHAGASAPAGAPAPPPAAGPVADERMDARLRQLRQLGARKAQGLLTGAEFDAQKRTSRGG